jgi:hypothetical protein
MAKELSPKQKKIAAAAGDKNKITGVDFKALKAKKAVEVSKQVHRKKAK